MIQKAALLVMILINAILTAEILASLILLISGTHLQTKFDTLALSVLTHELKKFIHKKKRLKLGCES